MDKNTENGQTLAELALVLPLFFLGIAMAVQLIFYCHNMIELQRMATVAADRIHPQKYRDKRRYYWFHSLHGKVTAPYAEYKSEILQSWRPFHGIATVQRPGRLVKIQIESDLRPGKGFGRLLPRVSQQAFAETMLEPDIPAED